MPTVGSGPEGNYVQNGSSINVGGDRNWRNNNPGNIEAGRVCRFARGDRFGRGGSPFSQIPIQACEHFKAC